MFIDVSEVLGASIIKIHLPDDGRSKHLSNVNKLLPDYTTKHPEDSHLHTRRHENLKFFESSWIRLNWQH
jgi:hypothetical protein